MTALVCEGWIKFNYKAQDLVFKNEKELNTPIIKYMNITVNRYCICVYEWYKQKGCPFLAEISSAHTLIWLAQIFW